MSSGPRSACTPLGGLGRRIQRVISRSLILPRVEALQCQISAAGVAAAIGAVTGPASSAIVRAGTSPAGNARISRVMSTAAALSAVGGCTGTSAPASSHATAAGSARGSAAAGATAAATGAGPSGKGPPKIERGQRIAALSTYATPKSARMSGNRSLATLVTRCVIKLGHVLFVFCAT